MSTLVVDIGGTGIKQAVLDSNGEVINEYTRMLTPQPGTPEVVMKVIETMRVRPTGARSYFGWVSWSRQKRRCLQCAEPW